MHIQNGVLDPATLAVSGAVAASAVMYAGMKVRHDERRWGLAAAGAAAVVAGHLIDVPLAGAGMPAAHLVGGALLAIALGPWLAIIAMAGVLALEAVAWGDGGVTAWGANMLVMGVVGVLAGWAVWRLLARRGPAWEVPAAALAGLASVTASSLALAVVMISGGAGEAVPTFGAQAAFAILESGLTATVVGVAALRRLRRARLRDRADSRGIGYRHHAVLDGEMEALG